MEIKIIKVGKISYAAIEQLTYIYLNRLSHWSVSLSLEKDLESAWIKHAKQSHSFHVALDEKGKSFSSRAFAHQVKKWREDPGLKKICYWIGGPYGLSAEILGQAHFKLRLSDLTLTSDLSLLILSEQLYRAKMILEGTQYHHE